MDDPQTGGMTMPTGIISKITHFSDEDKTSVLNAVQYVALAVIPVALANKIIKNVFNSDEPISKGSVELLAEIVGQNVLTTVLLYLVNKIIISIPTYTKEPIQEINLVTIAIITTFALFAFNNNKIADKFNVLYNRVKKMWMGNEENYDNKKNNKNKISVSKPVAKLTTAMPTHQESRADYVVTHKQMEHPQPPAQVAQQAGGHEQHQNQHNSSVGMDLPMLEEPAAFNSAGGFSSW